VIFEWLNLILSESTDEKFKNGIDFNQLKKRLEHFTFKTFAYIRYLNIFFFRKKKKNRKTQLIILLIRISELFDIIVDFPDSQPALKDLKVFKFYFLSYSQN